MAATVVKIWEEMISPLNEKCRQAYLRRDGYLDFVLKHEARMLDTEVPGRNSDDAFRYIAKHLSSLNRKPLNLQLGDDTVKLINDVCKRKNAPRDAFVNRVFLLLLLNQASLEAILWQVEWDKARDELLMSLPDEMYVMFKPARLAVLADIAGDDPFWYPRTCIRIAQNWGEDEIPELHAAMIEKDVLKPSLVNALGFNCYLPDEQIERLPVPDVSEKENCPIFDGRYLRTPKLDGNGKLVWVDTEIKK